MFIIFFNLFCIKSFYTYLSLGQKGAKKHACSRTGCGFETTSRMELNLHLQEKHETIGTIKCDFCDHTFFDDISLRRHRLLVHKELIHRFSCKICPVKTVEKGSMVQHYKKIHSLDISRDQVKRNGDNLDMYDCEHCEKSFDQKNSLNTHIKSVHLKIRHILCTRCPKTFQSHGHLVTSTNQRF